MSATVGSVIGIIGVALAAVGESNLVPGVVGEIIKLLGSVLTGAGAVHAVHAAKASKAA